MRNIGRNVHISDSFELYLKYKGLLGDFTAFIKQIPRNYGPLDGVLSNLIDINRASPVVRAAIQQLPEDNNFKSLSSAEWDALAAESSWITAGLSIESPHPPLVDHIRRFNPHKLDNNTSVSKAHRFYVRVLVNTHHNQTPEWNWEPVKPKKSNPNKFKEVI